MIDHGPTLKYRGWLGRKAVPQQSRAHSRAECYSACDTSSHVGGGIDVPVHHAVYVGMLPLTPIVLNRGYRTPCYNSIQDR